MKQKIKISLCIMFVALLSGCGKDDPGPLEGVWRMTNPIPMTITFSDGQVEEMGVISEVSYSISGSEVIVTYSYL